MNNQQSEILTKSIPSLFFQFCIANTISILALSSASFIDAIFVGKFCGKEALAAVNIISPIFSLMSGLQLVFGTGGSVRAGKYLGEGHFEKAKDIFTKTIIIVSALMISFSLIYLLFAEEVVYFLGAKEAQINGLASQYLRSISPFFLTWGVVYSLSLFIRVDGRPRLATFGLLLTGLINIILDALFVYHLQWGVKGAGLATGMSSVIPTVFFLVYFVYLSKNLRWKSPTKRWHELFLAAYNGLSEFLSEMSAGIVVFLFNRVMMDRFGTDGVAAFTAINYVLWFGSMTLYAVSDSITPLISVNYGAKREDRIRSILRISRFIALFVGLFTFCILSIFTDTLISFFLNDINSPAFKIGNEFSQYIRFCFFFVGFNMIHSAWMTAIHRPLESLIISGARALVLPIAFLMLFSYLWDIQGVYLTIPIAEGVTFLLSLVIIIYTRNSRPRRRIRIFS